MKRFILFVVFGLSLNMTARSQSAENEIELNSSIEKVTVFLDGAQIERTAKHLLQSGKSTLVLEKLSPFMDPSSISVEGEGTFTILGVNHRRNFLEKENKSKELEGLSKRREAIQDSIVLEQNLISVWAEEEQFLKENRNIKGSANGYELEDLRDISQYYTDRIRTIKQEQLAGNKRIIKLNNNLSKVNKQIQELEGKKDVGWSEIVIQIESKSSQTVALKISYLCANAGWMPTYDVWVKDVKSDIELVYQAYLRQDTREDWENVQLSFSNAEPNLSGQAPALSPLFLYFGNYKRAAPTASGYIDYYNNPGRISGVVRDENGEPLIGATIMVAGTTVGTISDMNGYYELSLPADAGQLEVSYVGFQTQSVALSGTSQVDVQLSEGAALSEIVVTGYAAGADRSRKKDREQDKAYKTEIPTQTIEFTTSVEFLLDIPYTIKSGNEVVKLDLKRLNIPASYEYISVPKLDETAYLQAIITDWEQYNLLEGEMSLRFEKTFVGKSVLDVRYATDTLELSLGRDKGIIIDRENVKEFSRKTFLGGKRIERRHYRTTVRNTRSQAIRIQLVDQVPISSNKDIEVESLDISGGELDEETGELIWTVEVASGQTITLDNKYEVKYPKREYLRID
ncbi:MAG: DUF4139 domain-containing protein [Bacteroidetes bacterium]|nr:DUF4139 domain-containing protein [Bacteroidota bacterium]